MLHSTASGETSPSAPVEEDTVLPDAPPQSPHRLSRLRGEEASRSSEKALHVDDSTRPASNTDVELEDLFGDDDDEEFPSSGVTGGNVESSPPTAPV